MPLNRFNVICNRYRIIASKLDQRTLVNTLHAYTLRIQDSIGLIDLALTPDVQHPTVKYPDQQQTGAHYQQASDHLTQTSPSRLSYSFAVRNQGKPRARASWSLSRCLVWQLRSYHYLLVNSNRICQGRQTSENKEDI